MVLGPVVLIGIYCILFFRWFDSQQPPKFNIKEVYMVDSLHFHKGTVDKNISEKAETEIGFSINNGKIKCKL